MKKSFFRLVFLIIITITLLVIVSANVMAEESNNNVISFKDNKGENVNLEMEWAVPVASSFGNGFYRTGDFIRDGEYYITIGEFYNREIGDTNVVITKIDENGNIVKQSELNGNAQDKYYTIISTEDGYIAAGFTYSTNLEGVFIPENHSNYTAFIVKYDKDLNVVWMRGYPQIWEVSDIAATNDGYVIVGDGFQRYGDNYWNQRNVIKIDNEGNVLWERFPGLHYLYTVFVDSNDDIIVGGSIQTWGNSSFDGALVKYDNTGNLIKKSKYVPKKYSEKILVEDIIQYEDKYVTVGELYHNRNNSNGFSLMSFYLEELDLDLNSVFFNADLKNYDMITASEKSFYSISNDDFGNFYAAGYSYVGNQGGLLIKYDNNFREIYRKSLDDVYYVYRVLVKDNDLFLLAGARNVLSNGVSGVYLIKYNITNTDLSNDVCTDYESEVVEEYNSYNIGDEVKYNGEKYYIIRNSDENDNYVTVLKKEPLTNQEIKKYGNSNYAYLNATNAKIPFNFNYECSGYGQGRDCINLYEGSLIETIVNNWTNDTFEEDDLVQKDRYKVRLISRDDLINYLGYGYHNVITSGVFDKTEDVPSWIYDYDYWTMSPYEDELGANYYVDLSGKVQYDAINAKHYVRPVVNINKCAIDGGCKRKLNPCNEKNNDLECEYGIDYKTEKNIKYNKFKIGEEVEYDGEKYYVMENSDKDDKHLTILKSKPLSIDELNTYSNDEIKQYNSFYEYDDGAGGMAYYTSKNCNNSIGNGCINIYSSSDVKTVIDNWSTAKFGDDLVEINNNKARLINKYDIIDNLGFEPGYNNTGYYIKTGGIVYDFYTNDDRKYWTLIPYEDDESSIMTRRYKNLGISSVLEKNVVRPVVNVDKCAIEGGCDIDEINIPIGCLDKPEDPINENITELVCKEGLGYDYKYRSLKPGNKVVYNDETYYVLEDSDENQDYITMLKDVPLTVEELYKYGKDNDDHLFVNEFAINSDDPEKVIYEYDEGIGGMAYYTSETCRYEYNWNGTSFSLNGQIDTGCIYDYSKSDVKKVVDNWTNDNFKDEDLVNIDNYKSRILRVDELIKKYAFYGFGHSIMTPSWLNNYSYWLMGEYDMQSLYYINKYRSLNSTNFYANSAVRPVVNVKKCAVDGGCEELINECKLQQQLHCKNGLNIVTKKEKGFNSFSIGDKVTLKGEEYHVIEESDETTNYLTLLKEKSLTKDELYKYGKDESGNLFVNKFIVYDDTEDVINEYEDGTGKMAYYTSETCGYGEEYWWISDYQHDFITNGCNNNYNVSDVKKVIDNWSNSKYGNILIKVDGYKARLIRFDELTSKFGFTFDSMGTDYFITPGITPEWLFDSNPYWVMDYYDDGFSEAYINRNGDWKTEVYEINAVRPVVNVDKCAVEGGCVEKEIKIVNGCIEDKDSKIDDKAAFDKNNKTGVNVDNTSKNKSNIIWIIFGTLLAGGLSFFGYSFIRSKKELKNNLKK